MRDAPLDVWAKTLESPGRPSRVMAAGLFRSDFPPRELDRNVKEASGRTRPETSADVAQSVERQP